MIEETQKSEILKNILNLIVASLKQLNRNAVFRGPVADDWYLLSILNSAHVVELTLKAAIATHHPLLIFDKLPNPPTDGSTLTMDELMQKGRSYDLSKLPQLYWAVTGTRVSDLDLFNEAVAARNIVQHFLSPSEDLSSLALRFTYEIADPILVEYFDIYPVEYNSNCDDYGYVVEALIREEIDFSKPDGFDISGLEGYPEEALSNASDVYRKLF